MADSSACNPQLLLSHKFPEVSFFSNGIPILDILFLNLILLYDSYPNFCCRQHILILRGTALPLTLIFNFSFYVICVNCMTMISFLLHRDVAVYALGVGACGRNAVDTDELKYVYHENGQQFIKVIDQLVFV